jgi:hypothetical protein
MIFEYTCRNNIITLKFIVSLSYAGNLLTYFLHNNHHHHHHDDDDACLICTEDANA